MNKAAQRKLIDKLLAKHSPMVRLALLEALSNAHQSIDRKQLINLLRSGNIEAAISMFNIERSVLFPFENAVKEAFSAGALSVMQEAPRTLIGKFGFDGSHPRAAAIASRQAADAVTYISDNAKSNARKLIAEAVETKRPVSKLVTDLSGKIVNGKRKNGVIGLSEQQTERMIRLRSILSDPEKMSDYFVNGKPRYKEADRGFDSLVRRAIKENKPLSQKQIDNITDAYKSKATRARAKRIAKNETFMAQASGRDEGYVQMSESDVVEEVTCRWQKSPRRNDREEHQLMDGKKILVGKEKFNMPDGSIMAHPHDPAGGPGNNVDCGCVGIYRIKVKRSTQNG